MKNNSYLEEWLSQTGYLYTDVFDDNFAINFEKRTHQELIELGLVELSTGEKIASEIDALPF